jgi:macrolide-specific efflux system membrane fusion protein
MPNRKMIMKKKKAIKWIVILVVAVGIGARFLGPGKDEKNAEEAKPTYEHTAVEVRDLRTAMESTGEIRPRNRLEVKPPIAGRLEELAVDEGDEVVKGQILGWISSTERATLLDAALANSTEEMEYWSNLYKPSPMVSPLSGTIIARNFEPGQSIGAADAVVVIADNLIVVANLDETDIGKVRLEQDVHVGLEAYPDKEFDCVVEKIAYDAQNISNVTMYEVDVRPVDLPAVARSGMTANLEFVLEERHGVLSIDSAAVMEMDPPDDPAAPRTGEVLIDSGDPEAPDRKKVVFGISDGHYTEIIEGLEEGDEVLIEKIKTGQFKKRKSLFTPKQKDEEDNEE